MVQGISPFPSAGSDAFLLGANSVSPAAGSDAFLQPHAQSEWLLSMGDNHNQVEPTRSRNTNRGLRSREAIVFSASVRGAVPRRKAGCGRRERAERRARRARAARSIAHLSSSSDTIYQGASSDDDEALACGPRRTATGGHTGTGKATKCSRTDFHRQK